MAKSISADKRENEKKRLARRAEKQKKKEEKKLSNKANSFEDMIAYVDENGMITSTPPAENTPKEEIKLEEIVISTPKKDKEEPVIRRGRIEFFNESKGFGFIKDLSGVEKYFFHINNVLTDIAENNIVTFDLERGLKGMNAVNVALEVEKAKEKKENAEKKGKGEEAKVRGRRGEAKEKALAPQADKRGAQGPHHDGALGAQGDSETHLQAPSHRPAGNSRRLWRHGPRGYRADLRLCERRDVGCDAAP